MLACVSTDTTCTGEYRHLLTMVVPDFEQATGLALNGRRPPRRLSEVFNSLQNSIADYAGGARLPVFLAPDVADLCLPELTQAPSVPPTGSLVPRNMMVRDAIALICSALDLEYRITPYGVLVFRAN